VAEDLAVFDEQTAREMLAAFKQLQASGLLEPDLKAREQRGNPGKTVTHAQPPIFVRNDSGMTIPPYSFMQMTGTVNVTDSFSYVKVDKPIDSTILRCPLLVNGIYEIANGEYGVAQNGPVFSLKCSTIPVLGDRMGPSTGSWLGFLGSMYAVIGEDTTAIEDDVYKVMFDTSSWRGKTKSGGLTVGTPALVKVYKPDGTLSTTEYTAETSGSNIGADAEILLNSQYGRWYALRTC
jgi:hypothetical protein